MSRFRLLYRSLCFYWRSHLAVLIGVLAGTAVVAGALVVGDSVRYSLRKMVLDRLGQIDYVLTSHRFFREELSEALAHRDDLTAHFHAIAPALIMDGSLERKRAGTVDTAQGGNVRSRVGKLKVYGVDARAWELTNHDTIDVPTEQDVLLSHRTAQELGAERGDEVILWIELPTSMPRDSLLGGGEKPASVELPLTVRDVLDESTGVGRFGLTPSQQLPNNAFVSLATLQSTLNLTAASPSRRNPTGRPARVNTLFVSANAESEPIASEAADAANMLTRLVADQLTLADLGLQLRTREEKDYFSLESRQMYLEDSFAEAGRTAASQLKLVQSPVLVYLANEITNVQAPNAHSMYSIVAGVDFGTCREPPFGPFRSADAPESFIDFVLHPVDTLVGNQPAAAGKKGIVLNEWLAHDLKVRQGDDVRVRFHVVGSHGELPEKERVFQVANIIALDRTPADDRGFTPEVKGITDVDDIAGWDQPFPMKMDRITKRDEAYWDKYRATPKAFVSLATAQEMWGSRYGQLTSLRCASQSGKSLIQTAHEFEQSFLGALNLGPLDLAFQPVKFRSLEAASGTTDFSGLFIGFSFFLILSAMILIGLLFRLGIERRGVSIGLLSALGFTSRQVRRFFLVESLLVVSLGGLLGLLAAIGYASLMTYGLKTWWLDAIGTRFLYVDIQLVALGTGFGISFCMAAFAAWWALREMRQCSARALLSGDVTAVRTAQAERTRARRAWRVGLASSLTAGTLFLATAAELVPATEAFSGLSWQVVSFFVVGLSTLTASLSFLSVWLDSDRAFAVRGSGLAGLGRLGLRNASRHRQRSVLSTGLISSATFVIVAVAAGHRNPAVERPDRNSGNGGFLYVAESTVPILADLNTDQGRKKLDIQFPPETRATRILARTRTISFRLKPGENASCLNIYQTTLPTILGVPHEMVSRGGFKFADTKAENPWELLEVSQDDGTIPILGDMNTLMYSLHKGIGDTIPVPDNTAPQYTLKIVGMLDGSVFQGVLLMSEQHFLRLYHEQAGYRYFLIGDRHDDTSQGDGAEQTSNDFVAQTALTPSETKELHDLLETKLTPYGFDAERVADRLADFLAVQNTYLSTFETLGGLGLLLGTFGLSTVMLRNVFERRSELALLRAVGFEKVKIGILVAWENAFLLLWGLIAGTISALLAMAPHLMSIGADVPWRSVGLILTGVFVVGMLAALAAVAEAVRTPVLQTLKAE